MSADREVTRIVRSWLKTEEHESADRLLDAVFVRIETTPQRHHPWSAWRKLFVSNNLKVALAGAAVLTLLAVGLGFYVNRPDQIGAPTPSPSPSPTAAPLVGAVEIPDAGRLGPGAHFAAEPFPLRISFVVENDWWVWSDGVKPDVFAMYRESVDGPDGRGLVVAVVENLYAEPCGFGGAVLDPPLGPTVDDLVNALSNQPSTDASAPMDVTLDGYTGKYVEYRMTGPDDECAFSEIRRWPSVAGPRLAIQDERDQVWVLDVDGIRLVVDAFSFSGTPSEALDEVRRVVESIRIDPLP